RGRTPCTRPRTRPRRRRRARTPRTNSRPGRARHPARAAQPRRAAPVAEPATAPAPRPGRRHPRVTARPAVPPSHESTLPAAVLILAGPYGLSSSWPDLFRPSAQHGAATIGVGRGTASPSLRTGLADLPHPALQLVVLPPRGLANRIIGVLQAEQPMFGKEGIDASCVSYGEVVSERYRAGCDSYGW